MRIPLLGVILKGVLNAAGHKIENLGEPTNPHDAATKKYVDENGGGGSVKLDDEVSETSANGVKSSGIWSFVKELLNSLATVATSGSYNDLTNRPKLPEVIELDEATKKLYKMKDGVRTTEEITSWATLFNLTKRGLIRLYYLASGSGDTGRKALYTAHMVDDKTGSTPAILFDATGFIGTNTVWTRTITLTKTGTDGINVEVGKLTEVAKKSDIPAVVPQSASATTGQAADAKDLYDKLRAFFTTGRSERAIFDNGPILGFGLQSYGSNEYTGFSSRGYLEYRRTDGKVIIVNIEEIALDQFVGLLSRSFRESEISNAAKVTAFTLPVSLFDGITGVKAFNVRCANSSSGSWDARVSWTFEALSPAGTVALGTSDVQTMVIGQYTRFTFNQKLSLPVGTTGVRLTCSGATRVALVPTSDAAYTVRGPTGAIITGYGVPIDVIGDVSISDALDLLAKRSLDPRGGVAANVNLTAPDGTRWALGVNNDGTLFTTIPDAAAQTDDGDEEIEI